MRYELRLVGHKPLSFLERVGSLGLGAVQHVAHVLDCALVVRLGHGDSQRLLSLLVL